METFLGVLALLGFGFGGLIAVFTVVTAPGSLTRARWGLLIVCLLTVSVGLIGAVAVARGQSAWLEQYPQEAGIWIVALWALFVVSALFTLGQSDSTWRWRLIGARRTFLGVFAKSKPMPTPEADPEADQLFIDYLERPDSALAIKAVAVFAQVNASRKLQARIVAWNTLRKELGAAPSKAQLDASAQFLYDRDDTALQPNEEQIRAYLEAFGFDSPELRPANAKARTEPFAPVSDATFGRWCTTYVAIGEQIAARIAGRPLETTTEEWKELDRRVHSYLSEVLTYLNAQRPKYWQRLSDRLKQPANEKLISPIQTADADGNLTGTYTWGHGDALRDRVDRVVQVLRTALEESAPIPTPTDGADEDDVRRRMVRRLLKSPVLTAKDLEDAVLNRWTEPSQDAPSGDAGTLQQMRELFDRPAFTTPFRQESSIPDFKKAITDTIEALNTGIRRLRDGTEIGRMPSRHDVRNEQARASLAHVVQLLVDIRTEFDTFMRSGVLRPCDCGKPDCLVFFVDESAADTLDRLRDEISREFDQAVSAVGSSR